MTAPSAVDGRECEVCQKPATELVFDGRLEFALCAEDADEHVEALRKRDKRRDPYGANLMSAEQLAELRSRLVAEAVAAGRSCEVCPDKPTWIVLNYEVEHLLCTPHAQKADAIHALQVEFWGGEAEPFRILRWFPERDGLYARRRAKHLQ
jgi:hypothetical protein